MLKIEYSGMFRFVDREIITDVSKYRNASVFTVRFVFILLRVFDSECKGPNFEVRHPRCVSNESNVRLYNMTSNTTFIMGGIIVY
jgi:hypothetical protein